MRLPSDTRNKRYRERDSVTKQGGWETVVSVRLSAQSVQWSRVIHFANSQ